MAGEMKPKPGTSISQDEGADTATSSVNKSLKQAAVVPPPSGTADAAVSAGSPPKARDSQVKGPLGDAPPVSNLTPISPSYERESNIKQNFSPEVQSEPTITHRGSNVSTASAEVIRDIEKSLVIPEEPEAEAEDEAKESGQAIVEAGPEDEPSRLRTSEPKTQDQSAASGGHAGASVED